MDRTAHISFVGAPVPSRRLPGRIGKPSGTVARREVEAESIAPFIRWVFQQVGLNSSVYRPSYLNRRLKACLRRLRVSSTDAAQKLLESRPELLHAALDTLLLGVSEFFRDREVFDYLRETGVAALLQRRERIRILSVGVSEGHELYSTAMILAEMGALDRAELVGVDCRPEAISRARAGCFYERDMAGIGEVFRERYFSRDGKEWRVNVKLRAVVKWSVGDVLHLDDGGQRDIIFFRNVVIYLTSQHADCAWSALFGNLSPNGMLVCGKADKPPASLGLVRVASCIYEKHGA